MSDPLQSFRVAILAALGHVPEVIEPGRLQRFSTSGRASDKAGWCQLFEDGRAGVFGDFRQGVSETWTLADRATLTREQRAALARQVAAAITERLAQQAQRRADNAKRIARVWAQCVPLTPGDPAVLYLRRRGMGGVWPLPECLRLHHALPYWNGANKLGTFPAMVATVLAPGGRMVALHRTYLTGDGRKANVPEVKKLSGASGSLSGAGIRLHKPRCGVIGIAEGIETALAARCASTLPTVAAYCAGNLAAWQWPAGVQRLVIFADHDRAGREAADTLRARALAAGLRAAVLTPTTEGADWADVWTARGEVPPEAGGAA